MLGSVTASVALNPDGDDEATGSDEGAAKASDMRSLGQARIAPVPAGASSASMRDDSMLTDVTCESGAGDSTGPIGESMDASTPPFSSVASAIVGVSCAGATRPAAGRGEAKGAGDGLGRDDDGTFAPLSLLPMS